MVFPLNDFVKHMRIYTISWQNHNTDRTNSSFDFSISFLNEIRFSRKRRITKTTSVPVFLQRICAQIIEKTNWSQTILRSTRNINLKIKYFIQLLKNIPRCLKIIISTHIHLHRHLTTLRQKPFPPHSPDNGKPTAVLPSPRCLDSDRPAAYWRLDTGSPCHTTSGKLKPKFHQSG